MSHYEIANENRNAVITNEQGVTCRIPGYVTRYDGDVVRIENMDFYHRINLANLMRELQDAEKQAAGPISPIERIVAHKRLELVQHIVGVFCPQKQR